MDQATRLKWAAIAYTIFWVGGMLWWSGEYHPANIVILAICGAVGGYLWYLAIQFLGLRNVCVERSASLLFHAGHDRQRNIHAGSTQRMLNAYNPKLRKYLVDNHYMETLAFHTIPGSTIIDTFGYRECPRQ